jgi:hypothetical protein
LGAAVPPVRIGAGGRRPRCASQHALSRPVTMQGGPGGARLIAFCILSFRGHRVSGEQGSFNC